jgi:hypothetical protein
LFVCFLLTSQADQYIYSCLISVAISIVATQTVKAMVMAIIFSTFLLRGSQARITETRTSFSGDVRVPAPTYSAMELQPMEMSQSEPAVHGVPIDNEKRK